MNGFFEKALLPDRDAKLYITSADVSGAVYPFLSSKLDEGIRHHTDLTICHLGGKRFVVSKGTAEYYKSKIPGADITEGITEVKSPYPFDAAYCAAVFGKVAVANEKITDPYLLSILKKKFTFINVSQGYAKCNICPIRENAVITEDIGIYKKLSAFLDVLLIEKGDILLPPYDYGFFGGSTGMIGKDTLFVNGDLKTHRDADKIYAFLEKHSVKTFELEGKIVDVGTIIAIG